MHSEPQGTVQADLCQIILLFEVGMQKYWTTDQPYSLAY